MISGLRISILGGILFLAGCVTTDPNGADTFSNSGVLSGSILSEEACAQWPETAVWVAVDGRGECLRYFHAGLEETNDLVHVWFHGDRMTQWLDGRAQVHGYYSDHADPGSLQDFADRAYREHGMPYIRFSRPGLYGSSGNHRERRLLREINIIDTALDALKARYAIDRLALSGQSGGGHVVASLLTRRDDIVCAVVTSGVVSVRERSIIRGWGGRDITGRSDYFDPIDHVDSIPDDPSPRIFIVGDRGDTNVPFSTQRNYHEALIAAGHSSWLIEANGRGSSNHSLSHVGFDVTEDCVKGVSPDAIIARYLATS